MTKARELADVIGTQSTTENVLQGRRNLIINGAMQVAQRGTSVTGVGNSATFIVDRFAMASGASSGTYTISQESDAPDGYAKSFKTLVTATGVTSGANNAAFRYKFEGQDLQHLKYGSSGAVQLTLSFWFKTNQTGTYQVNMRNMDSGRIVGATYTVSAADTWEQKTITFPADTTGSFTNDNNESLRIEWWLHSGASYNTGAVPTTWEALNAADLGAGLTVDLADTINNYAQITGVQLEVGSVATPFEHRSYGEELALCQRYYYSTMSLNNVVSSPTSEIMQIQGTRHAFADVTGYRSQTVYHPVEMRATPTIVSYNDSHTSGQAKLYNYDGTSGSFVTNANVTRGQLWWWMYTGCTVGSAGMSLQWWGNWTADAEL